MTTEERYSEYDVGLNQIFNKISKNAMIADMITIIRIIRVTCFFSKVDGLLGGGDIDMITKIFLICF